MGEKLARNLLHVTSDSSDLGDGGFWAVSTTFEGEEIFARFGEVVDANFPEPLSPWLPLIGQWKTSQSRAEYISYVESIRERVAQGWVYQVTACREITNDLGARNLDGLFSKILLNNPAPYASYLRLKDLEIASASPELFILRDGQRIKSSPIKGTQPRSVDIHAFGKKDESENIMIVDLMRNDFGRICVAGSVDATDLLRRELHPGLEHLVSDVEGTLLPQISWKEIFAAASPPGSVSGAPKSSALLTIARHEKQSRGPYCGILGWIHGDQAQLSVAIRTFWHRGDDVLRFGTGAGITWGSNAADEWEETQLKARTLIEIAGGSIE